MPDRPYKILLVQVGTLSFSHPSFGVPVLFIYLEVEVRALDSHAHKKVAAGRAVTDCSPSAPRLEADASLTHV